MRPPPSGEVFVTIVQEVIVPDRKRVRQFAGEDETALEAVVVDGRMFTRVSAAGEESGWEEVDFTTIEPDSAQGIAIRLLLMPVEAPLSSVPRERYGVPVVRIGAVQLDGQSCDVYRFSPFVVDEIFLGDRVSVDLTVAIAADDLVCWTEQRDERILIRTTLEMVNEPLTIEVPDDVPPMATPADR